MNCNIKHKGAHMNILKVMIRRGVCTYKESRLTNKTGDNVGVTDLVLD